MKLNSAVKQCLNVMPKILLNKIIATKGFRSTVGCFSSSTGTPEVNEDVFYALCAQNKQQETSP